MRAMKKQQVADLHPDLAVEVLSPGNTLREMKRKRQLEIKFPISFLFAQAWGFP